MNFPSRLALFVIILLSPLLYEMVGAESELEHLVVLVLLFVAAAVFIWNSEDGETDE